MILCKETSSKNIKTLAKLYYQRIWAEQSGEQISEGDFTFMYLADAFVQSDLHCSQVTVFYTFFLSALGFFPGNRTHDLALLAPCSTIWATGKLTSVFTSVCPSTAVLQHATAQYRYCKQVYYIEISCQCAIWADSLLFRWAWVVLSRMHR